MSIKKEYKKAIFSLSEKNKERVLLVLRKLQEKFETTPSNRPVYFEPVSYLNSDNNYDERDIVWKLQEWEIVTADNDEDIGNLLVDVNEENLLEAISLFELQNSESLRKQFEHHHINDLKRERDLAKKIMESLPYINGKRVRFRMSDFFGKYFSGLGIYEALDKVSNILDRFEKIGLIFDKEAGEPAMQNTVYTLEPNQELIKKYLQGIEQSISDREGGNISPLNNSQRPDWQDDFEWKGNTFVFGKYGNITFSSDERNQLFKLLTDAKGYWVSVQKMEKITGKDESSYIRPTIGQIEKLFKPGLRKYVSIPSTKDDNTLAKPNQGAYRIKFIPKPQ